MKLLWLLLLVALLVSSVCLPIVYVHYKIRDEASKENLFFGVSFGLNTTSEAKLLIDKVKGYTNLFVVNSWTVSTNETALNEICEYAVNANMSFIVFFDFISHVVYPWHQTWLDAARERWGSRFLGIYLYDEPGGRQIDNGQWDTAEETKKIFENVSDYNDASNRFVSSILSSRSMQDLKNRSIPALTSDYALYWFDYRAGYDAIFAEFGWNQSRTQQIALCRGAAKVQNKQWGAIITWTYRNPPYLESGTDMLKDMMTAYRAGAKYLIIFNYPIIEGNPYGILTEEHFAAMERFWNEIHSFPRSVLGEVEGQVAFVLPKDYGWGMRNPSDKIWGIWPPDTLSPLIWDKMTKLIVRYDLRLDIIYDDPLFDFKKWYSRIYFWNSTIV
jgi:hypothetical protein